MRAGTRAGDMLRSKWSSEEEKNKLESKRREVQEMMRGGRNLPRGNWSLHLQERHVDLLSFHLLDRFWLRSNSTVSFDMCAGGRPLIQMSIIYNFVVLDS
jgi:hypothetical protein